MAPILGIYASQISGHLFAPSGAYDSIATTTLGSTTSSITFSSIPSAYTHLQIRLFARSTAANVAGGVTLQFNGDTTGSNYYSHYIQADGSSVAAGPNASASIFYDIAGANANTSVFGAIIFDVLDYTNTSKNTTTRALGGIDNNGNGRMNLTSGLWLNTNAVTSITLTPFSGSFAANTHCALYGIRGN